MNYLNKLPPIRFPLRYSDLGTYIYDTDDKMVADVRGWGWIQKLELPEEKQDALGEFMATAANEKWARDQDIPLQKELERLYQCVVYDRIDDVDRKELWMKEVGIVVDKLVNEKIASRYDAT